jgi:hypothetical protein
MRYVLTTHDDVVKFISKKAEEQGDFIYLDTCAVYKRDFNVYEVDNVEGIFPEKTMFDGQTVKENPYYLERLPIPNEVLQLQVENENLKQQIQLMQQALDDLLLGGM